MSWQLFRGSRCRHKRNPWVFVAVGVVWISVVVALALATSFLSVGDSNPGASTPAPTVPSSPIHVRRVPLTESEAQLTSMFASADEMLFYRSQASLYAVIYCDKGPNNIVVHDDKNALIPRTGAVGAWLYHVTAAQVDTASSVVAIRVAGKERTYFVGELQSNYTPASLARAVVHFDELAPELGASLVKVD